MLLFCENCIYICTCICFPFIISLSQINTCTTSSVLKNDCWECHHGNGSYCVVSHSEMKYPYNLHLHLPKQEHMSRTCPEKRTKDDRYAWSEKASNVARKQFMIFLLRFNDMGGRSRKKSPRHINAGDSIVIMPKPEYTVMAKRCEQSLSTKRLS